MNQKPLIYRLQSILAIFLIASLYANTQQVVLADDREPQAQKGKAQAKPNTKSTITAAEAAAKRKTIGDLLSQADRGAGLRAMQKKSLELPIAPGSETPQKNVNFNNLNQVKPPRTSSFLKKNMDDNEKLERITDQQIGELFKLTQKYKNSPQRGELWLRLAELYVEKASVIDYRKQNEYDQKLKDYQSGKTKIKPRLDLSDARDYNKKAIQLYEWFVNDFPKDEKIDQALYFLGYNYYELGDLKKGTTYYTRLSKEYPKSYYVIEANFALAEFHFENEQWQEAKKYYLEVLRIKKHHLYSFSLYKYAWTLFRVGQTQDALKAMEILVRQGQKENYEAQSGKKNFNKSRLESEGLRDIVVFYSEVGEAEKAPNYFKALATKDYMSYLEKLAYLYGDKGNKDSAKTIFNYMIATAPTAPKAFDYKYQIVQMYTDAKKSKEFREELLTWVRNYGVSGAWYQTNKDNAELIDSSNKLREGTLRNYILQQHQTAQNSRAPFSQQLAYEGYKIYIAEFPTAPTTGDMHFYFGELLYDMNKFDEASHEYKWVVDNAKESKFYGKASENIVLALEKDLPSDQVVQERVGKTLEPVKMDTKVDLFISTGIWYANKFPTSEKTPEIKFRIGRLMYQHNQFDQAIPYLKDITKNHSGTKFAEYSANILLDIYNLKKDFAGLEKTAQELLAIPQIANSKTGQEIKDVLEKASFKRGQDLEQSKDFQGSAVQYESFAKQNPTSPLAITALFNAAINFERAGMNINAMNAHATVIKSNDKNAEKMKPKSRQIVAKLYQDAGMLDEAAHAFKNVAIEAGKDPVAASYFYNAAILFEAVGNNSEAIKNYEKFHDLNKKSDRIEAFFAVAQIHRKAGALSLAIVRYKDYVMSGGNSKDKIVESCYWVYELSTQLNRRKDAGEWKDKTLNFQKKFAPNKKGTGAIYAAKIKLLEGLQNYEEFKAIRIPANPQKQQAAVQNKIAAITKLNNQLTEIVKFDSPEEIVAALSIAGQANLLMGESLLNAPLPAGFTAEETKQYKAGIEKIAEPFMSKGKDSLRAAVSRGQELDAYSSYYHKARELILKTDAKAYYNGGEISSDSKQMSWIDL